MNDDYSSHPCVNIGTIPSRQDEVEIHAHLYVAVQKCLVMVGTLPVLEAGRPPSARCPSSLMHFVGRSICNNCVNVINSINPQQCLAECLLEMWSLIAAGRTLAPKCRQPGDSADCQVYRWLYFLSGFPPVWCDTLAGCRGPAESCGLRRWQGMNS